MAQPIARHGIRTFALILCGQLVSLFGTSLTGFALGVWVYQRTGMVIDFALIALFTTLPGILMSPISGVLVDRWNRGYAMILSATGAGLCILSVAILLLTNRLEPWHIYVAMGIASMFNSFQFPAYAATVTLLVPKEHLSRVSGIAQGGQAAVQILAPILAGAMMATIGIQYVLLIDFLTFIFAVGTLLIVRIPQPEASLEEQAAKGSIRKEVAFGWSYLTSRRGLLGLMLFVGLLNFTTGSVEVLITPLILSFASTQQLGVVLSAGGLGMLLGSLLMIVWSGPKRRVLGILGFTALSGVVLLLGGVRPSIWLVGTAAFIYLFCFPLIEGYSQVIWQIKVAPGVQGRVFALRRMVSWCTLPLAYVASGWLADRFELLLAPNGALAGSVGATLGVGQGRGIGLLFVVLGLFTLLSVVAGYLYPRLRFVERELPNVTTNAAPVQDVDAASVVPAT